MVGGAQFSVCRTYRYHPFRQWDESRPTLAFMMLNPSTADERTNDPTIARCLARGMKAWFGRLQVVNLFALSATDPIELLSHPDPVGPRGETDAAIIEETTRAIMVICAWGEHPAAACRAEEVLHVLVDAGVRGNLCHIGLNRDGSPKHPLYISASVRPGHFEWSGR
ncbi:hypothetical protein C9I57_30375 [Trinickia symbiotica]|uniref:DUF1643 domain-containing protein n=2 Tax=Trinickia symbiotica TaxID=863227 RepID=A0A2T3XKH7_9BURK|nr:hypothetical protein C9I57_30375 [Trinickia symbiotica]